MWRPTARGLLLADIVAKVFLGGRTKFLRAADAFYERRREGPYRFIHNRPGTSIVALKSDTAAEESKDQLSRDFSGRSIFDSCNNIGTFRKWRSRCVMSAVGGDRKWSAMGRTDAIDPQQTSHMDAPVDH